MSSTRPDFDVVIMGAGLSGIDAAYRLQTLCPTKTFTILEARESMGGTWDLFRYPGIRSDSDLYTLGFPFRPWTDSKSLADGPTILAYIKDTAREYGIDELIQYSSKVVAADFDTDTAIWTLTVEGGGGPRHVTCHFLYSGAGYYNYDHGYLPEFAGIDDYLGTVVHPQFWPQDLDYRGKRIVVIGSGATAVTLVPALAQDAAHVTMLQRSPTWIGPLPPTDVIADKARAFLPPHMAHRLIRTKNIALSTAFYQFCRRYPNRARALLTQAAVKHLGDEQMVAEHFTPTYNVWDQRVCAIPDADLFEAVKSGAAEVVTDHIDTFVPEGIRLASDRLLEADVVVTATGLELLAFGGVSLSVDGIAVPLNEQFVFLGAMLTGVPNFAVAVGYANASWTLRADLTARLVCKILNWMDQEGYAAVVPEPAGPLEAHPLLELQSGYVQRAVDRFPRQGARSPWRMRQNYLLDVATTLRTDLRKYLRGTERNLTRIEAR